MSRHSFNNTALVTGGASGIGFEFCKLLAKDGHDLVLVDMNEVGMIRAADELRTEYGVKVKIVYKDLSDPNAAKEIYEKLEALDIKINTLVNNAGFGLTGRFTDLELDEQLQMMQVNMNAVVSLTSYFLPELLKQRQASILNLASIAAFQAGPYMATYFASKAFVLSFSEALASELEGTSVSVTSVCPGPTDTGFASRAGAHGSIAFKPTSMMHVVDVAKEAYSAMKANRTVIIPGVTNKLAILASRFVPRTTVTAVAGLMNKRTNQVTQVIDAAV